MTGTPLQRSSVSGLDWRAVFEHALPQGTTWAVVHSSLAHVCRNPANERWPLLREIRRLTEEGVTLAFPSFTFSFCRGAPYHHRSTRSETGILADWVQDLAGALRTPHPIYSFVVVGPRADELAALANETTFGDTSSFALFERENARLVMLGCAWKFCTQFHRCEELAGVPYRYFKTFVGEADFGQGMAQRSARMFVRDLVLDCRNDFSTLERQLETDGAIRRSACGEGLVQSASCREVVRVGRALLEQDAWALVQHPRQAEYRHALRRRAAASPPLRIALLGHSNLHALEEQAGPVLADQLPDRTIEVYTPPYGQLPQVLLDPRSELYSREPSVTFFVDRLEDLAGQPRLEFAELSAVERKTEAYLDAIVDYRQKVAGWIFVHDFLLPSPTTAGEAEAARAEGCRAMAIRLQALMRERLEALPQVRIVDLPALASAAGVPVTDDRLWFLGRYPFSAPFTGQLARKHAGLVLAAMGRTARVVLVDLDHTLWGGVLGEDGVAGVEVGGDYPGNCFVAFQSALKALTARGLALAICSKNDEAAALSAMAARSEMRLKPDDIVAHRINWQPKWENALAICRELNLGPESALFIDDNPAEREQMRQQAPAIRVMELPDDPALRVAALLREPMLECLELTAEDHQRVAAYQGRRQAEVLKATARDLNEFYASLDLQLHLQLLRDDNVQRATQLLQKTNQFNTTTRRYDRTQLDARPAHHEVVVLGSQDKFSPFENVGVLILHWGEPSPEIVTVDAYLLSCRVLGKGLERAVLEWVKQRARGRGLHEVRGEIVETERNTPVRGLYRDAGFEPMPQAGWWRCVLGADSGDLPRWLTVVDRLSDAAEGKGIA